jgi:hypothetical protein
MTKVREDGRIRPSESVLTDEKTVSPGLEADSSPSRLSLIT